jgi:hypothetical protein
MSNRWVTRLGWGALILTLAFIILFLIGADLFAGKVLSGDWSGLLEAINDR